MIQKFQDPSQGLTSLAALFPIAKGPSAAEWRNKIWYIHTMAGYSFILEKEGNLAHLAT